MEDISYNLNIKYELPDELLHKVNLLYEKMPGWVGYAPEEHPDAGFPFWYSLDYNEKMITASLEPSGLLFEVHMTQNEWDEWIAKFKHAATQLLGYKVGEIESGEVNHDIDWIPIRYSYERKMAIEAEKIENNSDYEKSKHFKKVPYLKLFATCIAISAIAYFRNLTLIYQLCSIVVMLLGLKIIQVHIMNKVKLNRAIKMLKEDIEMNGSKVEIQIDKHGITTTNRSSSTTLDWYLIKHHKENNNETYLYDRSHNLLEIISESNLGTHHYQQFKYILEYEVDVVKRRSFFDNDVL